MSIKLTIDRLVIDAAAGQHLDPATLKAAVERHLATLLEEGGRSEISGGPFKTLSTRPSASEPRGDAHVAEHVAARIHEAMKR